MKASSVKLEKKQGTFKVQKELGTLVALLVMCLILAIISPTFRTFDNIINVMLQSSINAILAFAVLLTIIIGGTDLSVGSVLAFSGICMALSIQRYSVPVIIAILLAIVIGSIMGFCSGLFVTKLKLAPFMATLGMMLIGRGLTMVVSEGKPVSGMPEMVRFLGKTRLFDKIPVPVVITFIMLIITWVILKYTRFGRTLYAIGGNEEASRLSGINVKKMKTLVFVWSGALAGLAGVILAGRLNSAQAVAGDGYELEAIAAAVIGGASLSGGEGTAFGALLGALVMGVLRNGLNLMSVSANWQKVVIGIVLVAAVALDNFRKK